MARSKQELTEEHCQYLSYQMLRGLSYLHSANVVHQRLRPRSVLVNRSLCSVSEGMNPYFRSSRCPLRALRIHGFAGFCCRELHVHQFRLCTIHSLSTEEVTCQRAMGKDEDSERRGLVDQVKSKQRASSAFAQTWRAYCDKKGDGFYDPARHSRRFLSDFLRHADRRRSSSSSRSRSRRRRRRSDSRSMSNIPSRKTAIEGAERAVKAAEKELEALRPKEARCACALH